MALSIGIVGLPNVGKSTLFNALTKTQNAAAANYPFCTIEPNKAVVPVPDLRLSELAAIDKPEKIIHATVEFVDIAGLVKGASTGQGRGNQFLASIRETQAIVHVVRCFDNADIIHVEGAVNPTRDVEIIETELALADLQTLEKRLDKLRKEARGDKKAAEMLDAALKLAEHLGRGEPALTFDAKTHKAIAPLLDELFLLTGKKVIYAANVDEQGLEKDNAYVEQVRAHARKRGGETVIISAKMEEEMAGLNDAERVEFLKSYGAQEGGLEQVIRKCYDILGLQSYFTSGPDEVRAWTITKGWRAPQAAGVIHTDFEKGFIKAEVVGYGDYVKLGGETGARSAGVLRVEGKEYVMSEGDVVHFRFNV